MKIGILTITNGENYGNRLQNYAVQNVLENLGAEAETIKNITNIPVREENKVKKMFKNIIITAYSKMKFVNYKNFNINIRRNRFNRFTKKYIKQSKYIVSKDDVPLMLNKEYDFFVTGSDQVWNPNFSFNSEIDFLTFAERRKRITFAPSFGVSVISDDVKKRYSKLLGEIDHLSVRENAGAEIIRELTGREALVLLDPTMMLSKKEWLEIAKKPKWLKSNKYILMYALGSFDENHKEKIKKIACDNNYDIIDLLDINNKNTYSTDPSEFIYLINNSKLMYTDSFHGVVFSILMRTPFIVSERNDNHISMNSRIDTLMSKFDMDYRRSNNIVDFNQVFNMDFEKVDEILKKEREITINYLKNALNIEKKYNV